MLCCWVGAFISARLNVAITQKALCRVGTQRLFNLMSILGLFEINGDCYDAEIVVADEREDVVAFGRRFNIGFDAFECIEN